MQSAEMRFFTGDFKFYFLLLGKKTYLIDFSFKFNEIKFSALLTNWLMWGKMLCYFYNKFRPVNCMHYIKCAVNSSLQCGCCGRSMAPWIPVLLWHSIHKGGVLQIYFGVIFHETRHLEQAHITSGAFIHRALFGPWQAHRQQRIWVDDFTCHCLLWPLSSKTISGPTLGLITNLGLGWSWLFSAFSVNFHSRRSLKSLSV